jgi:5-oxoprolinase (ATP-hydrolysing) subunit A
MLIDLNADLGEGAGTDAELMPLITSANVSCGFHAGDPETVRVALLLAKEHRVAVGAHVGYYDREHYGRREFPVDNKLHYETFASCLYQIGALVTFAKRLKVKVRYVKPHGALYNQACRCDGIEGAVRTACRQFNLPRVGLQGCRLQKQMRLPACRWPFIPEGFADRRYRPDGSLVPRSETGALLTDVNEVVKQVRWLTGRKKVRTICVHGDNPEAVAFVKAVREALLARGFTLKPFA